MIKEFIRWAGWKMIDATNDNITEKQYIETRIRNWIYSKARLDQLTGERYYLGQHDILTKKRTVIGQCGDVEEVHNLPNNKRIDNEVAKYIDQKNNYILGKPISFECEDEEYIKDVRKILNNRFRRTLKRLGQNSLIGGIAWLCPYISEDGKLMFRDFPAYEILPIWEDTAHTELKMAIRLYEEEKPNAKSEHDTIQRVEVFTKNGIKYYTYENNGLHEDPMRPDAAYIKIKRGDDVELRNWDKIPLIPFKLNSKEIPLINRCKNLQDAINEIISSFKDNMEEDSRNTIIVLDNYDGQDLGEFRKNLAQYGAIKVRSADGARGDVRTLHIEVNYANYESILNIFKTAIKKNCRGYDFSDLNKAAADPNQMNIKSILSDTDIDANDMEIEFQAAFEEVFWFIDHYQSNVDEDREVKVIFNRDGIINEIEVMQMLIAAGLKLSQRTLREQCPYVNDVDKEEELVEEDEKKAMDAYGAMLPMTGKQPNGAVQKNPVKQTNERLKQMGGTPYAQPKQ